MPLVAAANIRTVFGTRVVLDGVSLSIEAGERVGIVGRNGTGKSTLLKAMAGLTKPDGGQVSLAKGCRVGFLSQDPDLDPADSLRGAAESAFAELHDLHGQLEQVFEAMATADGDELERLLKRQEQLETRIEAAGGYAVDHRIDAVLHGLGFTNAQFGIAVSDLSGGQKARLALAKLLLEGPDVLLLDEPTNHLDLDGRLWLESFLREDFGGAVVLISHDRYLLDNVVTRIVEVEQGRLIDYPGNYRKFRELRAERKALQAREWEAQQSRFKAEERFIQKYKAGQRAKQARGRESRLEREKQSTTIERPTEMGTFSFSLPPAPRSGDIVVKAIGVSKSYENDDGSRKVLFEDLDLTIARGERWGILGPNGAGKSTLVRTLLGEIEPDAGAVRTGSQLAIGYFSQSAAGMPDDQPVYRYLQNVILKENPDKPLSEQQARDLAGAFLFSGNEQDAEIGRLSGGEKGRARLAALLASSKNLLVLDEPTNHLDIPSAERLEEALALEIKPDSTQAGRARGPFDGTVIIISHDRALVDACCDHLLVLDGAGGAEIFPGNYTLWREREDRRVAERTAREQEAKRREASSSKRARASTTDAQRRTKQEQRTTSTLERLATPELEQRIEGIESRVRTIDESMADPDVWSDPRKCAKLGEERAALVAELEPLEFEWMRRAEEPT